MVLKLIDANTCTEALFENDVKVYGTQTKLTESYRKYWFENDVEVYGTQTGSRGYASV